MINLRSARLGAGLAAALTLGGCVYDDYGSYGGGSVAVGYGSGGYYDDGYYDDGYGGGYYGGGYSDAFYGPDYGYGYGWYDNFYYPGYGIYIYDRGGHRHNWRDRDRDHWRSHPRPRGTSAPRPGDSGWRGPRVADGSGERNRGRVGTGTSNPPGQYDRGGWSGRDRGGAVVRPQWDGRQHGASGIDTPPAPRLGQPPQRPIESTQAQRRGAAPGEVYRRGADAPAQRSFESRAAPSSPEARQSSASDSGNGGATRSRRSGERGWRHGD